MSRMTMNTYWEPVQPLAKCERCGFEASAEFFKKGKCASCRDAAKDPELSKERATVRTIFVRACRRFGHVPDYVRRIVGDRKPDDWIDESSLPDNLRWRPKNRPGSKRVGVVKRRLPGENI